MKVLSVINGDLCLHNVPFPSSIMRYLNGLIKGADFGYHYFCLVVNKEGNVGELVT